LSYCLRRNFDSFENGKIKLLFSEKFKQNKKKKEQK